MEQPVDPEPQLAGEARLPAFATMARRGEPPFDELLLALASEFRWVDRPRALERLDELGRQLFGLAVLDPGRRAERLATVLGSRERLRGDAPGFGHGISRPGAPERARASGAAGGRISRGGSAGRGGAGALLVRVELVRGRARRSGARARRSRGATRVRRAVGARSAAVPLLARAGLRHPRGARRRLPATRALRTRRAGTATAQPAARPPVEALLLPYYRAVIDQGTEFGARVARHLREEIVVWMTTVTPAGSPLPSPVWFLWDGAESVVMYSMPGAAPATSRPTRA